MSRSRGIWTLLTLTVILALLCGCGSTASPTAAPKPTDKPSATAPSAATAAGAPTTAPVATAAAPTAAASVPKGGTFIFRNHGEPTALSSIYASDGPSLMVMGFCMNGLVKVFGSDVQPDLAESWSSSTDGLTWTFKLRKDVKWQDGQPFTAKDVVFTFQAIQNEKNNSPYRSGFLIEGKPIVFEAVDDYTVRAVLPGLQPAFVYYAGQYILPEHVLAKSADLEHDPYNQKPIGTGPFQVTNWKAGDMVELTKFKDYFRGEPYLDKVVFRIVPDTQASTVAVQTGEIHLMASVDAADVSKLEAAGLKVMSIQRDIQTLIHLNVSNPILSDVRVRKAMMYGIDRDAMVVGLEKNYAKVCDSIFHESAFVYQPNDPKLPAYKYDAAKAGQLLDEAGWKTGPDGIRQKDGQPLKLTFLNINVGGALGKMATVVQAQLRIVGFDISVETVDIPTFVDRLLTKTCPKPYDITLDRMGTKGPDPDAYYSDYYTGLNPQCYSNTTLDALFDQGRKTADLAARKDIYQKIEQTLWDELPILPMWYPRTIYALSSKFGYDKAVLDADQYCYFRFPEWIYQKQ